MAEPQIAAEQPQLAAAPMFSPGGNVHLVPNQQVQAAMQNGGELAVPMRDPQGTLRYVRSSQVKDAMGAGGRVDFTGLPQPQHEGFWGAIGGDLFGAAKGVGMALGGAPAMAYNAGKQTIENVKSVVATGKTVQQQQSEARAAKGYGLGYRAAATAAENIGVNVPGMEQSAALGDTGGVAGHAAAVPTVMALTEGAARIAPPLLRKVGGATADAVSSVAPSIPEATGTTPARIAELKSFPQKAEAIRQTAVAAEQSAKKAASAQFPKFNEPIEIGRTTKTVDTGLLNEQGKPITRQVEEVQTTTFRDLQEQRSALLKQIADEKRAVMRGAAPRFDLSEMYGKLHGIDDTMTKAALDQGGEEGLAQLKAARQQFGKYMQDFHNPGSPVRPLLEAKPGETMKVVQHFLNADKGARTLEVLGNYGINTDAVQSMLGGGSRPLRVTANESAKLRKVGEDAYIDQRLRESLSQATYNELPSAAEARLPAAMVRSKWPSVIGDVPGANILSPRRLTRYRLERALKERANE